MTPEDHSGGPMHCDQLGPFVDGELGDMEAAAFRRHLIVCARCQQEMHGLMQLSALAEQSQGRAPAARPELAPVPVAAADRRAPPRRAAWLGVVGAVAMAAALVLALKSRSTGPDMPALLASLDARTVSGWPSAIPAAEHRAYATSRGTTGPATNALARAELQFEANQSWRELATLSLLRRDFQRAEGYLQHVPDSPGVLSDRGLILLEQSNCEKALEYFDRSLSLDPEFLPAQFNRGVCLRTLGYPHAAIQAFSSVARANAGGWSVEAQAGQKASEEQISRVAREREPVLQAVRRLGDEQQAPPGDVLQRFPSFLRSSFYHSLAAAGTGEEIERLRRSAREMDASFGGEVVVRRVTRALHELSPRRAALASAYEELRRAAQAGKVPPAAQLEELLARARQAHQSDIALQVYESFLFTDTGAERTQLVQQTGDPWFRITLAYARAHQQTGAGHLEEAERILRSAQRDCGNESLVFACYWLHLERFEVYSQQGRMAEALREARSAADEVRREIQPDYERKALLKAAEVQIASGQVAAARALFEELMARQRDRCTAAVYMMESLAEAYVENADALAASRALASAPACEFALDPWRVALRLRLALLQGDREGLGRSKSLADALAATPGIRPQEVEEARLLSAMAGVELEAPGASAALESLLSHASAVSSGRELKSRRADARVALTFDALRRAEPARGLSELAALLETSIPQRCAVGLVQDVGRTGWIVLDAQGSTRGSWSSGAKAGPALPEDARAALRPCRVVDVLATGSLQGLAGVLPDEVAWAYRIGSGTETISAPGAARRMIVRGATPPADLGLPPLGVSGPRLQGEWTVLEGRDATPRRVLAEMQSASVVDLEVHGWVDPLVPDGAALALSEDGDGRYALTPSMLRPGLLTAHPLVMLGACRAAQGSPFRKEPWSLPAALVGAGARAVLASRSDLPDAEVGSFFDAVRRRVESGAQPAVALRDERIAALGAGRGWVRSVVAFESPFPARGSP